MKALFYTGTMSTEFREGDPSTSQQGEVLVQVSHCGICGSDMHAWHGHDPRRVPPMILGHEAAGVVLEGELAGSRVAVNPLLACGTCTMCKMGAVHLCENRDLLGMGQPGAFAETVAVRETSLTVIPENLTFDQAALSEPLAVAVHAVELAVARAHEPENSNTIILGGGAIGLLVAETLRVRGFNKVAIAETNPLRSKVLSTVTEADIYDPINGSVPFNQVDLVFDAVGSGATRSAASQMVRPGGTIVHIGLQDNEAGLDTRRITLQEICFIGAYCYQPSDFAEAVNMLANGDITRDGWSEIRPLSEGGQGFQDIHDGKALPKIILEV